jgi:hypothetical protein
MTTVTETEVRSQLLGRLKGRGAHMPLEEAVADFPTGRINEKFPNGTYSTWALVEHLRRTQWDILDYIRNPHYEELEWPKDYWPAEDERATPDDWAASIQGFQRNNRELQTIAANPESDLFAKIPWGGDYTILREILIVTDHNAYHIGELAIMRQVMGTWPAGTR